MARGRAAGGRQRWTPTRTSMFLDRIAAGQDAAAAAEAAAVDVTQAYRRLRDDDGFARGWRAATEAARLLVETQMIAAILHGDGGFDRDAAMRLVLAGRRAPAGDAAPAVATREETDALILDRLAKVAGRSRQGDAA